MRGTSGPATTSFPLKCPQCEFLVKNHDSLRIHFVRIHKLNAEQTWLLFREHPGPCTQCAGPVKFISIVRGFERCCGKCTHKNGQLKGAANRKSKNIPAWNKGLTKETNESVRLAGERCSEYFKKNGHHSTGKTKENSEVVRRRAEKQSKSCKDWWKNNRNKVVGRTKETHPWLAERGRAISAALLKKDKRDPEITREIMLRVIATRRQNIIDGVNSPFRMSDELIASRLEFIKESWALHEEFTYKGFNALIAVSCLTCHEKYDYTFTSLFKGRKCVVCNPHNTSIWHKEVYAFFQSLDSNASINNRKAISPFELDILSSDEKFAIECNGLYWHSEACSTDPLYHQNKTDRAKDSDISVLHLFEDEWKDPIKQRVIKSMIAIKLNHGKKISARKLRLLQGKSKDVSTFIEQNHLDGNVKSSRAFWLVDENDRIVMALTVRKPHQQTRWKNTLEVARIASLCDHVIVGGMSKLVSAAVTWAKTSNYENIISYRDLRLGGSGVGYDMSGFVVSHTTSPRFWWTNGSYRIDRFAVRAVKGKCTQEEMASDLKLFKIFGCSNVVHVRNLCDKV